MANSSNRISKVAIIGAGGNSGKFMTEALLATGKHTITALSRPDSQSVFPSGVHVAKVDYTQHSSLVDALCGQDALVITLSGHSPAENQERIIRAAADAEVPWILPNEWSPDSANEAIVRDVFIFKSKVDARNLITQLGKSSYIALSTGFWYEWSLAIPPAFGIDMTSRKATLFDDGNAKISISTWPQVGRAVASLLSLPVAPESANPAASLHALRDRVVYVNSFTVSQRDMLASAFRVTGSAEADWAVTSEDSRTRFEDGLAAIKEGQRIGFAKMLYTRIFFPDGCGNTEEKRGTINALLGLPVEELDEATVRAYERAKVTGADWVAKEQKTS